MYCTKYGLADYLTDVRCKVSEQMIGSVGAITKGNILDISESRWRPNTRETTTKRKDGGREAESIGLFKEPGKHVGEEQWSWRCVQGLAGSTALSNCLT